MIEIKLEATEKNKNFYILFLTKILTILKLKFSIIFLPKKNSRFALLKSPHVNKKAQEHFETNKFKTLVRIFNKHHNQNFLSLLLLNKPKFIKVQVRKSIPLV
jgi:ribosomal protein S10